MEFERFRPAYCVICGRRVVDLEVPGERGRAHCRHCRKIQIVAVDGRDRVTNYRKQQAAMNPAARQRATVTP